MADATKLGTLAEIFIGQWSRKGSPAPKLASPIDADDTTLVFTVAFKDEEGAVITAGFPLGIRKSNGWTETCWVPAGGLSADGLTATGVVRGVDPAGTDYTTGSAAFADEHDQDEPVFCNIPAFFPELMRSVLQGLIASGGSGFIIGTDASGTVTIYRSTGVGTKAGFMRWYTTSGKTEYSNNGSAWVAIDDTVASVLFKTSSTDTTPGYGETKIIGGSNITITKRNTGGNEYLEISTVLGSSISAPGTYTPAYLTGDNTAESNYLLWLGTSTGTARITINGVQRDISVDFTTGGITNMAGIATKIQTAIRALTGALETVAWSTDHFIIHSVDTTATSAVTVTSATGSGTDISGAGAFGGLGCDVGHGVVTDKVLDQTQDSGKILLAYTDGRLNPALSSLPNTVTATAAELNKLAGASANVTAANLNTLTAGVASDANGLHKHLRACGAFTWDFASSKVVAHGLGVTPNWIKLDGGIANGEGGTYPVRSTGEKVGATYACKYTGVVGGPGVTSGVATDAINYMYNTTNRKITVTADATNLTFAIDGDAGDGLFLWECGV